MTIRRVALPVLLLLAASAAEWPNYGGNPEGTRYSPLKQITRGNVSKLRVAWTFDTGPARTGLQTQPIVVKGVVYGNTPSGQVIALNGATGELLWSWDSKNA